MSDTSELYYAEMEAARNAAEKAYFDARPQIDSPFYRKLFKDGFERAYQPLYNDIKHLEELVAVASP